MSDSFGSNLSHRDNVKRYQKKVDIPTKRNVLDISTDCSRLVFDRLTLNQLIHLRAVCHAWNHIITDICAKKRELRLFFYDIVFSHYYYTLSDLNLDRDPQLQLSNQNMLVISQKPKFPSSCRALKRARDGSFSEQKNDPNLGIRFIARLFPNITNFVCFIKHSRMYELNYILWKWAPALDTLTLSFNDRAFKSAVSNNALEDFVKCFEQLSSLKRCHLHNLCEKFDFPNARTFNQLEEFSFENCFINFVPYYAQLDANRCRILRVGYSRRRDSNTVNMTDANPELTSKLTHLSLNYFYQKETHGYLAKFQNLIYLEILKIFALSSIIDVLQEVAQLPKLQTLLLNLKYFAPSRQSPSEWEKYHNNPNYRNTLPIFCNTVTELQLLDREYESHFPEFRECQLLARIFPRVANVKIYSNYLNKATFDAQFRSRFNVAFGRQVELKFIPNMVFNIDDVY